MIKSFRDLEVYLESKELAFLVERLVRTFPESEKYLLVDQMRRASRDIPSLIAEGYAKRDSLKNFQKYLKDALGEANEMIPHLELADQFGYIGKKNYAKELMEKYDRLGKRLSNLRNNWKNY